MFPDLAYTRRGPAGATPVVLLHGIGHRRQAWEPVIERLALTHDVIAPDLSGFGQSPAFAGEVAYSMENAVRHLEGQFRRWSVAKPHVVGNSLGGAIALELGSRGMVSSVTALSPAGFFGPVSRFQALVPLLLMRLVALFTPKPLLRRVAADPRGRRLVGLPLYARPERHDADETYADSLALKHATAFERTAKEGVRYRFDSQVPVPTTVAWGTKDRLLPYSQAAEARRRLPQARHEPLPGAGHVPMADDPDLVCTLIEQTVASAATPPTARGARTPSPRLAASA